MHLAVKKCKLKKTTDRWNVQLESKDKIIAIQSDVEALKKNVKLPKANLSKKEI